MNSRYGRSDFYIMNATGKNNLFPTKRTIEKAKEEWADYGQTVLVAQRHYGYGKKVPLFIFGSGTSGYNCKAGDRKCYTQDTGNGYKYDGERLTIENVVVIDKQGSIDSQNNIGLDEKRNIWVMK